MTTKLRGRKESTPVPGRPQEPELMKLVLKHWRSIVGLLLTIAGATMAALVYREARTAVVNLTNADMDQIKEYLQQRPSILHCDHGGERALPPVFTDLQRLIGDEYAFATIDCDLKLPSGKTVWEKYNLNRKMKPVIFGVAPWAKAVQASLSSMKSVATLRVLFENKLAAKANIITSTADLLKTCGWSSKRGGSSEHSLPPCIAVAKGARFNQDDADLLRTTMRTHTNARFVTFAAKDRRLNVEDLGSYAPGRLGARYYALRNDSSFLVLDQAPTEENVLNFVSSAINSPMESYLQYSSPISLIKYTADRIKEYSSDEAGKKKKKSKSRRKKTKVVDKGDTVESDNGQESNIEAEMIAARERQIREAEIRERMSQEERDYLFEEDSEEWEAADEDSFQDGSESDEKGAEYDEEDDADVIEL